MESDAADEQEDSINELISDVKWDRAWNSDIKHLNISSNGLVIKDSLKMLPIRANKYYSSGVHSWKIHIKKADHVKLGVVDEKASKTRNLGADSHGYYLYTHNGTIGNGSRSVKSFDSKYYNGMFHLQKYITYVYKSLLKNMFLKNLY